MHVAIFLLIAMAAGSEVRLMRRVRELKQQAFFLAEQRGPLKNVAFGIYAYCQRLMDVPHLLGESIGAIDQALPKPVKEDLWSLVEHYHLVPEVADGPEGPIRMAIELMHTLEQLVALRDTDGLVTYFVVTERLLEAIKMAVQVPIIDTGHFLDDTIRYVRGITMELFVKQQKVVN